MKKYFFLFLAAFLSLGFVACSGDDDDNNNEQQQGQSIIGQWSGCRPDDVQRVDKYMHYKFNQDGTFEMIMEAWAQHRLGKYTVNGNEINMEVQTIEWLWDRENGYTDALDESGYESFAAWKADRPEEWNIKATYKFDKDGNLYLDNGTFNLDLVFFSDPNYVPKKHIY